MNIIHIKEKCSQNLRREDQIVNVGDCIYHPPGFWTKQFHNLLEHIRSEGFLSSPVNFMLSQAAEGNKTFAANIQDNHHLLYLADIECIKSNQLCIEYGLCNEIYCLEETYDNSPSA